MRTAPSRFRGPPPRSVSPAFVLLVGLLASPLGACKSGPKPTPMDRGVAPEFASSAERYNAVVAAYDHLWSPVALRIKSPDPETGKLVEELLDGHLQAVTPDRVALRIDKLSETYAYLGCDSERYWWIDIKAAIAIVGTHVNATPESLARFELPVQPLDLVELLGIMPMDPAGYGATRWSTDGKRLGLLTRSRSGNRLVWVDPATFEPREIELTDSEGRVTITSVLTRPERIPIDGDPGSKVRIPTNHEIRFAESDMTIVVRLQGPENRRNRVRAQAFDIEGVMRTYGVREILDADAPPDQ
jgi:hypothetical protein